MSEQRELDRRKVLKYGSTLAATTALGLAGCLGGGDDDGDDAGDGGDGETGDGGDGGDGGNGDAGDGGDGGDSVEATLTLTQFPDTIDPLDHITGDYFNVFDHVYEPLFEFIPGEGIFSWVVESQEPQGDGTTELTLRDNVVFHNGDDLTAEDVAWTINRTVDPDFGVQSPIGTFGLGSIEGAEALDERTVAVNYSAAPGLAEFEYGNYARAMNRQWSLDNYDAANSAVSGDSASDFNGTGPYEVVEFVPGERIVAELFDDYWGMDVEGVPVPPFDRVTFTANSEASGRVSALEAGESDLILNVPPGSVGTLQDAGGAEIRRVTSFRSIFLPMKNTIAPFDSLEFRQAMNYAVDNAGIVQNVLNGFGEARGQPVSPGINGFNPDIEPYEQDLDLAESLVEESGYGGTEITLTAPQGRYLRDAQVAQAAGDQINQLPNVTCNVDIVEFPVVSDANSAGVPSDRLEADPDPGDIDIPFYMIGWGVITGDTDYGTQGFFTIPDNPNRTFDDEELSNAILDSQQIQDPEERTQRL